MNQGIEIMVEVRNNGVLQCPVILQVDRALAKGGCRLPLKRQENGSVLISGTVHSISDAKNIQSIFFNENGTVKSEFDGEVLQINWQ